MLELIGIITLGKAIQKIVTEKGLKPTKYILLMVILWLGFEVIGLFVGMILFGNVMTGYLLAFPGAAMGGYISYSVARNATPAQNEYRIEDFGKDVT